MDLNPLLLQLPIEFETERLLLRCYRPGDGEMYYRMVRENWDHLNEFLPSTRMALQGAEDAEALICQLMAIWLLRELFIFGVWEKANRAYVGETYLANPDWDVPCIELGYFLVRAHTGKGFATEAA